VKAANSPDEGRLQSSHISVFKPLSSPVYMRTWTVADISSPVPSHTAVYSVVDFPGATPYSFWHTSCVADCKYLVAMKGSVVVSRLLTVKVTKPSEISVTVTCFSASNEAADASDVVTVDSRLAWGSM